MSKEWTKAKTDFYEQLIMNDSKKFVLWKEVNNQNLSIAQRKFLRTLICAFHNKIGAFEFDVCNLTCIQIRQIVELFSRYLLNQMICLEKEIPKPKRKDLGYLLKQMDKLDELYCDHKYVLAKVTKSYCKKCGQEEM